MSGALAPGSIGIGLYLHDLPAVELVDRLVAQARLAEDVGFDSATVAEHHGGFRSYLPNPTLAASWILAATDRLWSGPNPLLLPLRNVVLAAEDLAWLAARFPGRVAAGVAAGYQVDDFTAVGVDGFDARGRTYGEQLVRLATALRGEDDGPLGADHAVQVCRDHPIPVVGAAGSKGAARRAARAGTGLLFDSMTPPADLAQVVAWYEEAGGAGPRLLGRRVWVGEPPMDLFEAQLASYQGKAEQGSWLQRTTANALIHGRADEVIEQVLVAARAAGATGLALRVHLPGLEPAVAEAQLRRLGEEVLPGLREAFEREQGNREVVA